MHFYDLHWAWTERIELQINKTISRRTLADGTDDKQPQFAIAKQKRRQQ